MTPTQTAERLLELPDNSTIDVYEWGEKADEEVFQLSAKDLRAIAREYLALKGTVKHVRGQLYGYATGNLVREVINRLDEHL